MFKKFPAIFSLLSWGALLLSGKVAAQPLDDVTLEYQEQGVVATIRLTGPIHYLNHFPASHGKTLEIYYERVQDATSNETWVDNEVRNSPSSGLIPGFTVTSRDQQTKPRLVVEFTREAEFSVAPGKDNRSLLITIHPDKRPVSAEPLPFLPTIKPEPAAQPAAAFSDQEKNQAEMNKQARALMVQGRDALAARNNEAAVEALNQMLLLPPNDYTQDGQEWIGVARERAGQLDKARIEYDLYLRLYPDGEGASRVAQRLSGLGAAGDQGKLSLESTDKKKQEARLFTYGSVSTRYLYGKSKIDSTYTFNNAQLTSSLSQIDQSMYITSVDASERYVSEDYDSRLVFRDVNTKNQLANQPSINRVNAAYGEIKNRKLDYLLRVGRQSATGGGVLGRFDGLAGSYGDAQEARTNVVAGALADYSQGAKPVFLGMSVDRGAFSLYGINQQVDGTQDRRALGGEWHYFEGKKTGYAMVDYDTYFRALNAVQFMGSADALGGTVHFMLDRRKAPSLSIRNALNGAGTSSINALLQTMSQSSLRGLALARTATSSMGQIGLSVPVYEKWQVGGDVRLSNTTGMAASGKTTLEGILPAIPSRGAETGVTGQVIGSSLHKRGDIWSGSVTFNSGKAVKGRTIYLYNHAPLNDVWAVDTSLQQYKLTDQFGGITNRISPMIRSTYRIRNQLTFDLDAGYEKSNFSGAQQVTKTTRYFGSAGLRLDF